MTTTTPTMGLADTLKTKTQPAHTAAERHDFQGRVLRGQLGTAGFVAQLGQYYLVHTALTSALENAKSDARVAQLLRPYHTYPDRFEADLRHFGVDPSSVTPVAATRRMIDEIASADPLSLLGFAYVAEGSTNGGKFIGQALRRALELSGGEGLSSLDPHGEAQRERWQQFRSGLDQLQMDDAGRARLIAGAEHYFQFIIKLFNELNLMFPINPANLPVTR
ncbi:MAG: biliverdin-producing heme oxygenase [Phycisphaeraceae bacterium]|nr:biliverdin-producing heme oxygenase [Phycisphaeraceae bacterium]